MRCSIPDPNSTETQMAVMLPDPDMLALAERIARFIQTLDTTEIAHVFADRAVSIIENFAPYRFDGHAAVAEWAAAMSAHRAATANLRHTFGPPQDYSRTEHHAFFSLPTSWTGTVRDRAFAETGGWAFVLVRQSAGWRVQSYGWAVTSMRVEPLRETQELPAG